MKIETPLPKKNHNVSSESDGYRFIRYIGFFIALLLGVYVFLIILSHSAVHFISIEKEKQIFSGGSLGGQYSLSPLPEILAERYRDVPYEIFIIDMDSENAFADLGGRIYITQDLIDHMDYVQELDFILGHEIGHLEKRHVLRGLITDIPLSLILTLFGGEYGNKIFEGVLSNNYSKYHETVSDRYGLDFSYNLNGHVGCALDFFEKNNTVGSNVLEIFSTHPMSSYRISRAQAYAEKQGYTSGECTTLDL